MSNTANQALPQPSKSTNVRLKNSENSKSSKGFKSFLLSLTRAIFAFFSETSPHATAWLAEKLFFMTTSPRCLGAGTSRTPRCARVFGQGSIRLGVGRRQNGAARARLERVAPRS